jgi:hypothetical protein
MWYDIKTRETVRTLHTSLTRTIASHRKYLAEYAVSPEWKNSKTDNLLDVVQEIAALEAKALILDNVATWLESAPSVTGQDVYNQLVKDFMSSGANDTWSGRGNDLKRIVHEAKRETIVDLEYGLTKLA